MAGGPYEGAREIDYRGSRFALGRTQDAYAIWRIEGGAPVRTFPLTDESWPDAWLTFQAWDAATASPTTGEQPPAAAGAGPPPLGGPPSGPPSSGGPPAGPTPGGPWQPAGPGAAGGGPYGGGPVIDQPGWRYALGRAEDRYWIWDMEARTAVESFPQTDEGWRDAWTRFQELDRPFAFVPTAQWRKGQPIPIRAMRAGQIVSASFKLYFMYFWVLVALIATILIPVHLITGALSISTLEAGTVDFGFGASTQTVQNPPWVSIVNAILYVLTVPFVTAAVLAAIGEAFVGRRVRVGNAYRVGFRRALPVLWVSVLVTLAITALFVPAILAAIGAAFAAPDSGVLIAVAVILMLAAVPFVILLAIRFFFATSIVVLEQHRGTKALRRSWELVRGLGWKIFGNYLLIGLIQAGIALVVILVGLAVATALFLGDVFAAAGGFSEETFRNFLIFSTIFNAITTILLTPFSTLAIVLLYFDARVRKEGFTEEVFAREYGAAFPPSPGSPQPGAPGPFVGT